ncbi:MAG: hypothetical protein APF84_00310 [Gracilibacter sp. BRH_c7a]|nr:MAG: hypothetical protein APF84_00310 [Gracilibacter sp. BRH_c7a]
MSENIQDIDYQWFLENYSELFAKHGVSYLAIKNKTILGVYESYADGVRSVSNKEKPGTFIVQNCNGNESAYTNYIASTNFFKQ